MHTTCRNTAVMIAMLFLLSACADAQTSRPTTSPSGGAIGPKGPRFATRTKAKAMKVSAAGAERVVVAELGLQMQTEKLDLNGHRGEWKALKLQVSETLLDWTIPTGAAGPSTKPQEIDVLADPDIPVTMQMAGQAATYERGFAPGGLSFGNAYIFFLSRDAQTKKLFLAEVRDVYVRDATSLAEVKETLKFNLWNWGPPAGNFRAMFIPYDRQTVTLDPGSKSGSCVLDGWLIFRNAGTAPMKVTVGAEATATKREISAVLGLRSAAGAKADLPVLDGAAMTLAPGRCAIVSSTGRNEMCSGLAWDIPPGDYTVQASLPLTQVNGKPPAAGTDVVKSAPVNMTIQGKDRPPPDTFFGRPAKKIIFVLRLSGPAGVATVRKQLGLALTGLRPEQSFDVICCGTTGKITRLSAPGPVPATSENKRKAFAFIESIGAAPPSDPLPALKAARDVGDGLIYFLTDVKLTDASLPESVAALKGNGKPKINTILMDTFDKQTEEILMGIARQSEGTYRFMKRSDL